MKYKSELLFTVLFVLFFGFVIGTSDVGDKFSLAIFTLLFLYIPALCVILIAKRFMKKSKNELVENFNNQPMLMRILIVLFLVSAIFELIVFHTMANSYILLLVIFIVSLWYWLHEKENE